MQYISTRGGEPVSAAEAIVRGISPSGGLFVPQEFPSVPMQNWVNQNNYPTLAATIMQPYLDMPEEQLLELTKSAYSNKFDDPNIAPIVKLDEKECIMELFHGPTLAFKDMALQMLPYLMRHSLAEVGGGKQVYILVATSGDTGKAALEGFCDVPGTAVHVFYPHEGVSRAQLLQMVTQQGKNVYVSGVHGNFDDAQTAVKCIFANASLNQQINEAGFSLSSANSINFGRLLPQIAYYYSAYAKLVQDGSIKQGDKINFCVPTGNFGNILAGYYALRMGLPIKKLICASNRNNVLTGFFQDGVYNARRPFYKSMSCSIDILVSSNLERLLFEAANRDASQVSSWMQALSGDGSYRISDDAKKTLGNVFYADWCDEQQTLDTIRKYFDKYGYLMDPHTAVAQTVFERYRAQDDTPTVLLSTAHPFKFASDVLGAFEKAQEDEFENVARLSKITGVKIPDSIAALENSPVIHDFVCDLADMPKRVLDVL
ncbi:threonine synthase [Eubacteriales bacterium OttesenSCG-928-K08]|nr:threonine synthase [Eubacteriales bacterium OttesenSCG-928-K08]